jgi:hypothetical protein
MARTTNEKKKKDDKPSYRRNPVRANPDALAMSIENFCELHGFSQDMFFKMQREGWGPDTIKVGARTLITREAAAKWRRQRQAAAGTSAA